MKTKFLRDIKCTDIVYSITLHVESQTQALGLEAVAELWHCVYGHPKMIKCLALFYIIE